MPSKQFPFRFLPAIPVTSLRAKENLRSCIAFRCCVPLVTFNLGQFESVFVVYDVGVFEEYSGYFVDHPLICVCLMFPHDYVQTTHFG